MNRRGLVAGGIGLIASALSGRQASADWVADTIAEAAMRYGIDPNYLVTVAMCESNLDPGAVGVHGEIGVLQFMPDTFYAHGGSDIWSVADQADVAARMFANGESYHWLCA